MRPEHLSASQLTCFLACPRKYRFRYVDKVEPAFKSAALVLGSAVHSSLEWLHRKWREGLQPEETDLRSIFEADLQAQAVDPIGFRDGENLGGLQATGEALLGVYLAETVPSPPRAVELPFAVELVHSGTGEVLDVPLRGVIDLVEGDGTVVELKTAARSFDETTLALHLQLSAYSYAVTELYGKRPPLRLDCLLKTKRPRLERIPVERSEADDARLFLLAQEVLAAIKGESFFPNPSWQCRDCEFRHLCPAWNP